MVEETTKTTTTKGAAMAVASSGDIHELFCHYDALYFHGSLGACSVSWISTRKLKYPGTCRFYQGGGCEILLSEPLLKSRSPVDLKNVLLHEMIHAYLWFKNKNKDHSEHGPTFQDMMNSINSSAKIDHQRPIVGYNVNTYHKLPEEVDGEGHIRTCESCGDLFSGVSSGNQHQNLCSGCCYKIGEPSELDAEKSVSKVEKELTKDKSKELARTAVETVRPHEAEGVNPKSDGKKSAMITNFLPPIPEAERNSGNNSPSQNVSQRERNIEDMDAIEAKCQGPAVGPAPRKPIRVPHWKHSCAPGKRRKLSSCRKEYTVVSEWLDLYADEEEEEHVEPLVNKRTERRKKQQQQLKLMERSHEIKKVEGASTCHLDIYCKNTNGGNSCMNNGNERMLIPHTLLEETKAAPTNNSDHEEGRLNAGKGDMVNYSMPSKLENDPATVCSIVSGPSRSAKREGESSELVPLLSVPIRDNIVDISDD